VAAAPRWCRPPAAPGAASLAGGSDAGLCAQFGQHAGLDAQLGEHAGVGAQQHAGLDALDEQLAGQPEGRPPRVVRLGHRHAPSRKRRIQQEQRRKQTQAGQFCCLFNIVLCKYI
jgi:hypothetical protein